MNTHDGMAQAARTEGAYPFGIYRLLSSPSGIIWR
jgi:hypothetical protein